MRPEKIWDLSFTLIGAIVLGGILLTQTRMVPTDLAWVAVLVILAGLLQWFEIPLESYHSWNLSPIVYFTVTVAYGVRYGMIVTLVAPLVGTVINRLLDARSLDLRLAFSTGGASALSLGIATYLTEFTSGEGARLLHLLQLSVVSILTVSILSAVRVGIVERIALSRLLRPFSRLVFPHILSMMAAVLVVWLAHELIGPLGIILSMIVVVEAYYPWKLLGEQRALFMKSLQMMSNAVDLKDPYTAHHSRRVAESSVRLARALSVPEEEVERIRIGALMHDIGKIAVPGSIIRKPSKLTFEEMELMKNHVETGAALIGDLEILEASAEIVLHHHENYDGSGYPHGIAGEAIPLGSRIVFVADAFDALTTDRPYRKGRSQSEALEVVRANVGTQFDPKVVRGLEELTPR